MPPSPSRAVDVAPVRFSFPSWRVFIFGVDVTNDVTSMVVNWTSDRRPNLTQITLSTHGSNHGQWEDSTTSFDRYIITESDLLVLHRDIPIISLLGDDDIYSSSDATNPEEFARFERPLNERIRENLTREIEDPIKRRVLLAKFAERFPIPDRHKAELLPFRDNDPSYQQAVFNAAGREDPTTSYQQYNELTGMYARWPMLEGHPIFHAGDVVRAFWCDPFNPDDWYFACSGVIAAHGESIDANGNQSLSFTVEGTLRILRRSWVTTNTSIFDHHVVVDPKRDAVLRTWAKDNFRELTLPEITYIMLFGSNYARILEPERQLPSVVAAPSPLSQFRYAAGEDGELRKGPYEPIIDGAGALNYEGSKVFVFGPPSPGQTNRDESYGTKEGTHGPGGLKPFESAPTLETWQRAVDTKVPSRLDDLLELCLPEYREEAKRELIGGALDALPDDPNTIDPLHAIRVIGSRPDWFPVDYGRALMLLPASLGPGTNRDLLLKDLIAGVATETEFLSRLQILYNICDRIEFFIYDTPRGDVVVEMPLRDYRPSDFGEYEDRYTFRRPDIVRYGSTFSDENLRTEYIVNYYPISGDTANNNIQVGLAPAKAVSSPSLIPIFGLQRERLPPTGVLKTAEAAAWWGRIKLTQTNADVWSTDVETVLRAGLGPNRPLWFETRNFMANVHSITQTIRWGQNGTVTQALTTNYRRSWSGMFTPGSESERVYEPFGGRSAWLDYSLINRSRSNASNANTKPMSVTTPKPHDHEHDHDHNDSEDYAVTEAEREVGLKEVERVMKLLAEEVNRRRRLPTSDPNYLKSDRDVTAADITGSTLRSIQENAREKGEENSYHLFKNGRVAVDIGINRLTTLGIDIKDMDRMMLQLQANKTIPRGAIVYGERDPKGNHDDHIHYQWVNSSYKTAFAPGER